MATEGPLSAGRDLVARRPVPGHPVQANEVQLSAETAADLGSGDAPAVLLTAGTRRVWVRGRVGPDQVPDTGIVLGRAVWRALSARPGSRIWVCGVASIADAERVQLVPPFHVAKFVAEQALKQLRQAGTVVYPGARLLVPSDSGRTLPLLVKAVSATPATIGADTEVQFLEPNPTVGGPHNVPADVGGAAPALGRLRELIHLPLQRGEVYRELGVRPVKGILLEGPPGTGKTLLCRVVAGSLGVNVLSLAASELVGAAPGETEANLRTLFTRAMSQAPTLVLLDEIDVIAGDRGRLASQNDIRIASQFLSLMDGLEESTGVVVIGTTNRIAAIDRAFRRPGRFDEELAIGLPDRDGRLEILEIYTRDMPFGPDFDVEEALGDLADRTRGFVGADLMHLVREIGLSAVRRTTGDASPREPLAVQPADVRSAVLRVSPSLLRGATDTRRGPDWDDIVGLQPTKRRLVRVAGAVLGHGAGAALPEGVLVHGAPGSGKTVLARALADHLGATLVVVEGASVFTQWLGQSEEELRKAFHLAREVQPTVLLFDQIDALASANLSAGSNRADERVVAALLAGIDAALSLPGVFPIATTSRPDAIDGRVLRSGRLGIHVEVPLPDAARRAGLAQWVTARTAGATALEPRWIDALVTATEGSTAADVLGATQDLLGEPADRELVLSAISSGARRTSSPPTQPPMNRPKGGEDVV
jgi:transitional endoplasmic reticulum ATPase